jgi:hypothetical protein
MRYNAANRLSPPILSNLRKHRQLLDDPELWHTWAEVYPRAARAAFRGPLQEQEQDHEQKQDQRQEKKKAAAGCLDEICELIELGSEQKLNGLDRVRLQEMVETAEEHRQGLGRGQPGADVSGAAWVSAAIVAANGARRRHVPLSINFVDAVLRRWMEEGFRAAWGQKGAAFQNAEPWQ